MPSGKIAATRDSRPSPQARAVDRALLLAREEVARVVARLRDAGAFPAARVLLAVPFRLVAPFLAAVDPLRVVLAAVLRVLAAPLVAPLEAEARRAPFCVVLVVAVFAPRALLAFLAVRVGRVESASIRCRFSATRARERCARAFGLSPRSCARRPGRLSPRSFAAKVSRPTSLLKRSSSRYKSASSLASNARKNRGQEMGSSDPSPENPGKLMRIIPGSLPFPVPLTAAGCPPLLSTHLRIVS